MNVRTMTSRTPEIVFGELTSLADLVEKRQKWLRCDINKNRSTYNAVARDTLELEQKLAEMRKEYEFITNKTD